MAHNLSGIIKSIRDIMREDRGINGDAQRIEQLGWMLFLKIFDDKDQELELIHEDYHSPIPTELQWRAWAANAEGITGDELLNFVDRTLFPALRELNPQRGGSVDARALMVREVFEGNNNYMKSGVNLRKVINKLSEVDFNAGEDRHLFGDLYEGILRELQSAGDSGEFYTPRAVTQFMTEMLNPQLGETVLDPACGTGGFLVCTVEHLKQQVRTPDERLRLQETVRGMEYKPLPFVLALTNLILHDVELPRIEYGDSLARQYDGIRERDRVNVILANPPFGGTVANGNETNFPANFRTKESADLFLVLIMQLLKQGGRAALVLPDGLTDGRRREAARPPKTSGRVQSAYDCAATELGLSALRNRCHQPPFFRERYTHQRSLVLRTPPAGRTKIVLQNEDDSSAGVRADSRMVEGRKPHKARGIGRGMARQRGNAQRARLRS